MDQDCDIIYREISNGLNNNQTEGVDACCKRYKWTGWDPKWVGHSCNVTWYGNVQDLVETTFEDEFLPATSFYFDYYSTPNLHEATDKWRAGQTAIPYNECYLRFGECFRGHWLRTSEGEYVVVTGSWTLAKNARRFGNFTTYQPGIEVYVHLYHLSDAELILYQDALEADLGAPQDVSIAGDPRYYPHSLERGFSEFDPGNPCTGLMDDDIGEGRHASFFGQVFPLGFYTVDPGNQALIDRVNAEWDPDPGVFDTVCGEFHGMTNAERQAAWDGTNGIPAFSSVWNSNWGSTVGTFNGAIALK